MSRWNWSTVVGLGVGALLVVFGGCSSDDGGEAAAPTTTGVPRVELEEQACSLLAPADLEAQGLQVASGPTTNPEAAVDECVFELEPEEGTPVPDQVLVSVYPEEDAALVKADNYPDAQTLEGLGQEAWVSPTTRVAQVRFEDGSVVSVQWVSTEADDPTAVLTQLATVAADNR